MNPHSFHELLREYMQEKLPGISARTPVRTGELVTPYLLLSCSGEELLVPNNNTWECTLAVELYTNAYDNPGADSRSIFSRVCSILSGKETRKALNERASDFYLYTLTLRNIEEPDTEDGVFVQRANFRVLLQF